ncbi:MFS transporter, partial [Nonomuraea lactucae]|uniref:MFS transporter n=1 Tax=Nonomuraea lactucae TaxID=2249762 RepID=UPI000DE33351
MTSVLEARRVDAPVTAYDPRRWKALPLPLAALFMMLFDFFAVGVAAPSAQRALTGGVAGLELIVSAFAFTYAAGLVAGGVLGDRYGLRRMLMIGGAGFVAATALCGLAPTLPVLLCARLVAGAAAALLVPQAFALVTTGFPPGERPRAFALLGATLGLAGMAGQALGGVIITADLWGLGWRAVFFVNAPIGLLLVAAAPRLLPAGRPVRRGGLDGVGLAL